MKAFLKAMVHSPARTGAVLPSSSGLTRLIVKQASLGDAERVVELGCGTGVFTKAIVRRLGERAEFFGVEIDPGLARQAREAAAGHQIIQGSATALRAHLEQRGWSDCDRVICGLPWANFSQPVQDELMDAIVENLSEDGVFVTFAYLHGKFLPTGKRFRRELERRFTSVTTTRLVWRNLPPAFVYRAVR